MKYALALAGPRGSGKSTIAEHLVNLYGFERLAFSDILREIARLAGPELSNDRQYLLELGNILRTYDPDMLVKVMEKKLTYSTSKVVIEDVRFQRELEFCQDHGILTIYLEVGPKEQLERLKKREKCSMEDAKELANLVDNHLLSSSSGWDYNFQTDGNMS